MTAIVQVALGGAIGAVLRYLVVLGTVRQFGASFPWGVLVVNLAGCFAMGLLFGVLGQRSGTAPFLLTGVLGGFTTYSAFSLDVVRLVERGSYLPAAAYVVVTVSGAVLFCGLGYVMTRGASA